MLRKSFLGLCSRAFHSAKLIRDHNRYGIIGVPLAKGQRKAGVDLGPSAIRSGGLISNLKEIAGREELNQFRRRFPFNLCPFFRLCGRA